MSRPPLHGGPHAARVTRRISASAERVYDAFLAHGIERRGAYVEQVPARRLAFQEEPNAYAGPEPRPIVVELVAIGDACEVTVTDWVWDADNDFHATVAWWSKRLDELASALHE